MQVLDHACDSAIDQADQPLNLWAMIERCVSDTIKGLQGRQADVMALVVFGTWNAWSKNALTRLEDCIASRDTAWTLRSSYN